MNLNKQNCYIQGTGHLIIDCYFQEEDGIRYAIQMNPNYMKENAELLRKMNSQVELI